MGRLLLELFLAWRKRRRKEEIFIPKERKGNEHQPRPKRREGMKGRNFLQYLSRGEKGTHVRPVYAGKEERKKASTKKQADVVKKKRKKGRWPPPTWKKKRDSIITSRQSNSKALGDTKTSLDEGACLLRGTRKGVIERSGGEEKRENGVYLQTYL